MHVMRDVVEVVVCRSKNVRKGVGERRENRNVKKSNNEGFHGCEIL